MTCTDNYSKFKNFSEAFAATTTIGDYPFSSDFNVPEFLPGNPSIWLKALCNYNNKSSEAFVESNFPVPSSPTHTNLRLKRK